MKKIILIFGILLLSISLVLANGDHKSEIEEGKKLVESGISCDKLTDEQLEAIGEYYMEQMHPGESHELMHKMMGLKEGSDAEEQFHINMAKTIYCSETNAFGFGGVMGGGMMNMMMSNMMGYGMMGNSPFGYGYGYLGFFGLLYIALLIGLVVLVYLWIIKLWKELQGKGGKK